MYTIDVAHETQTFYIAYYHRRSLGFTAPDSLTNDNL